MGRYADAVAALSPSSYWRLGEASGSVADSGSGGITGTVNGTATRDAGGGVFDDDGAIDFDGASGYVDLGDNYDMLGTASFSVALWCRADASLNGVRLIAKNGGGASGSWEVLQTGSGEVRFSRTSGTGEDIALSATGVLNVVVWRFVVCTYDGATLRVYVDGAASGTPVAGTRSIPGNASTLKIARQANTPANYFNGALDEVAIWSGTVLTATQIANLYAAGNPFPTIMDGDTQSGNVASNATSFPLTYPTNLVAGDLILAVVSSDGAQVVGTWPAGWVAAALSATTTAVRPIVAKKVATGSETGTFNVTGLASEQGAWRVFRISGWAGVLGTAFANDANSGAVEVLAAGATTGTTPNPPTLDPANWTTENTLWLAGCAIDTARTISAYPYPARNTADISAGTGGATLGLCSTASATGSLDPGPFTISATDDWVAFTIGIRPTQAAQVHALAAVLTGIGTGTGAGGARRAAVALLAGAGATTGRAGRRQPVTSALTGTGTVTPAAGARRGVAVTLGGAGSTTAAGGARRGVAVTLTGSGTAVGNARRTAALRTILAGAGLASATFTETAAQHALAALLAGAGTTVAGATARRGLTGGLTGAGTTAAVLRRQAGVRSTITGTGSAAATARRQSAIRAALTGTGNVTPKARSIAALRTLLAGAGATTGTARRTAGARAALTGQGSTTAAGRRTAGVRALLAGQGSTVAVARRQAAIRAALAGAGLAQASIAGTSAQHVLAAALAGSGATAATMRRASALAAALTGTGSGMGAGTMRRGVVGTITADGTIDGALGLALRFVGELAGAGDVVGALALLGLIVAGEADGGNVAAAGRTGTFAEVGEADDLSPAGQTGNFGGYNRAAVRTGRSRAGVTGPTTEAGSD